MEMERPNEEQRIIESSTPEQTKIENKVLTEENEGNRSKNCTSGGGTEEIAGKGNENTSRNENPGVDRGSDNNGDDNISGSKVHGGYEDLDGIENMKSSSDKLGERTENNQNSSVIEIEKRQIYIEDGRSGSSTGQDKAAEEQIAYGNEDSSDLNPSPSPRRINCDVRVVQPHSQLPKPETPPGLRKSPSTGEDDYHPKEQSVSSGDNFSVDMPAIGKYIREQSNNFSAAIAKRIMSFKEGDDRTANGSNVNQSIPSVSEGNLSGLKVIVQLNKEENRELNFKGRISFFSRSNCRDCTAVRTFFREQGLKFVEINIDVYPLREKELIDRTGSSTVPQIFFNENHIGGLVALNSLRNSGQFEQKLKEIMTRRCPENAPSAPLYGFDDPDEDQTDEMLSIIKVLRQKLPIRDRLMKMKIVKNCFSASEMVDLIIQQLGCGRTEAVEIGKELAKRHFIHHVFGEHDFEDGKNFYRLLEHEAFTPKCFNFRGSTNDSEPKPAAVVGERLTKLMFAILESYASEDRLHVDYLAISTSEEFRRYVNMTPDLQRINVLELSEDEKLAFFLNLYNAMVIHAVIRVGCPQGVIDRRSFFANSQYIIGGHPYSLNTIQNGILRSNRRQPYSWMRPFGAGDKRLEVVLANVNPLIHFSICNGTKSSPKVRFFSSQGIEAELRSATREFFHEDGMDVNLEKRTVHLSRILKWYSVDFGEEKEILKWIVNFLDSTKAGLLTHLLSDGGAVNVVYQDYDWSLNS
ncbi:PREDICTED: uncharacterized protein LOC104592501 [Nelumbo nucifera]|uniref:Uncharacterized protein LOC104592501 n=2 Tax=Nelumbo nucifera TaxID=4432 RepID=A0A1U7ZQ10_NELNU|nr:PREDICTED: uncharacterized protein LOC104592501 [Nelumbo nucifera]DAD36013.1 TPA_asm: hypothetical protein HUJ06_006653 [Nelumbo nucifera]